MDVSFEKKLVEEAQQELLSAKQALDKCLGEYAEERDALIEEMKAYRKKRRSVVE